MNESNFSYELVKLVGNVFQISIYKTQLPTMLLQKQPV